MSFPIQFNSVSAYYITSTLIKKPEKDLGFKDVGRGICKIVCTSLYKNRCYAPVFYCWRVLVFIIMLEMRVNSLPIELMVKKQVLFGFGH